VRELVKAKQKAYADLSSSTSEEEKREKEATYKVAKKLAKKAVAIAKNIAYERSYQKLETKEGEKDAFKLARAREKRTRDLGCVRCIKGEDGKVLVEEVEIRDRWRSYFPKLFNGEDEYSLQSFLMLFLELLRCLGNGGLVRSSHFTRTRAMSKIVIIIVALNC